MKGSRYYGVSRSVLAIVVGHLAVTGILSKPRTVPPFVFCMKYKELAFLLVPFLVSCGSTQLSTSSVGYQSVRTTHAQPTQTSPIPDDAKIAVAYYIGGDGALTAVVYNRTSEVMTIDQTKSFFVNSDGKSVSYYDPTVRSTSVTDMSSVTKGVSVNLGSITSALGIGGPVGLLSNGINLGGSGTSGAAETSTTYVADLPQVSLAPHSNGAMSKTFHITGIGAASLSGSAINQPSLTKEQSYCRFSVCISYSIDGGQTFDKLVTDFYANSKVIVPVTQKGRVNDALRQVYQTKQDAINEYWWLLNFNYNIPTGYNKRVQGILYDYK